MRLGLVGFGKVGRALARLLVEKKAMLEREGAEVRVNYVLDIDGGVYAPRGLSPQRLLDLSEARDHAPCDSGAWSKEICFPLLLEKRDADVVVEMTPTNKETGEPGLTHIREALTQGFNVVTSNKGPILLAYKALNELARKKGVQLGIGCTCGGALPSITAGIFDMAGSQILTIEGVLNGTTNFIINTMDRDGVSYHEALAEAQRLGIAETDPRLDVQGWDTATKLLILTNVLMDQEKTLKDISVSGITELTSADVRQAQAEGKRFRLIGTTLGERGELRMSVRLEKVSPDHPFYSLAGANKAVRYVSDTLGNLTMMGGASDLRAAAASLLRDLINIHRRSGSSR